MIPFCLITNRVRNVLLGNMECQLKPHKLDDTVRRVEEEIFQNGEEIQKQRLERKASRMAYQLERKARKEKEAALLSEITRN